MGDGLPKVLATDPMHPAVLERLSRAARRGLFTAEELGLLAVAFPQVVRERAEAQAEVRRLERLRQPRGWARGW